MVSLFPQPQAADATAPPHWSELEAQPFRALARGPGNESPGEGKRAQDSSPYFVTSDKLSWGLIVPKRNGVGCHKVSQGKGGRACSPGLQGVNINGGPTWSMHFMHLNSHTSAIKQAVLYQRKPGQFVALGMSVI